MFAQRQRSSRISRTIIIGSLGLAVLLCLNPWKLTAQDLTWTPGFEVVTLAPGESQRLMVAFDTTRHFGDGVVQVASELQPFVQVQPVHVPSLARGETRLLTVTIAVPSHAQPGQVKGTIRLFSEMQLGVKGGGLKYFADPLPFADPFLLTVHVVPNPG